MSDEFHIVVEIPEHGFQYFGVYMAALDVLRARGWKPNGDSRHVSIENVSDENGTRLSEEFDGWDANGNDAWVSRAAYSSTKLIKIDYSKSR